MGLGSASSTGGGSGGWFKYDDESVKFVDNLESQLLSIQKAYIMFYEKIEIGQQDQGLGAALVQPKSSGKGYNSLNPNSSLNIVDMFKARGQGSNN